MTDKKTPENTCITDNLPKECALNFRTLEVKLNTIRNNDLTHIENRINEVSSLVRAILIVILGGFLGVIISAIF